MGVDFEERGLFQPANHPIRRSQFMKQIFQPARDPIRRNIGGDCHIMQDQAFPRFDAPHDPFRVFPEDFNLKPPIDVEFHVDQTARLIRAGAPALGWEPRTAEGISDSRP
jgi:hypothetical protein